MQKRKHDEMTLSEKDINTNPSIAELNRHDDQYRKSDTSEIQGRV